jgi:hypothetical protein
MIFREGMLLTVSSFSEADTAKFMIFGRLDALAARAFATFSLERFCPRVLLPMTGSESSCAGG